MKEAVVRDESILIDELRDLVPVQILELVPAPDYTQRNSRGRPRKTAVVPDYSCPDELVPVTCDGWDESIRVRLCSPGDRVLPDEASPDESPLDLTLLCTRHDKVLNRATGKRRQRTDGTVPRQEHRKRPGTVGRGYRKPRAYTSNSPNSSNECLYLSKELAPSLGNSEIHKSIKRLFLYS